MYKNWNNKHMFNLWYSQIRATDFVLRNILVIMENVCHWIQYTSCVIWFTMFCLSTFNVIFYQKIIIDDCLIVICKCNLQVTQNNSQHRFVFWMLQSIVFISIWYTHFFVDFIPLNHSFQFPMSRFLLQYEVVMILYWFGICLK